MKFSGNIVRLRMFIRAVSKAALATVMAIVGAFGSSLAGASTVLTFDFEDLSGTVQLHNYFSQGFRFSPNCHWDTEAGSPGKALAWDASGCEPNAGAPSPQSNPDWLGAPHLSPNTTGLPMSASWMFIDYAGANFSLMATDLIFGDSRTFLSSKGGILSTPNAGNPTHLSFFGDQWTDIGWLMVSGGGGQAYGIDNLVVRVPEPATAVLVAAALIGVATTRRRRHCAVGRLQLQALG